LNAIGFFKPSAATGRPIQNQNQFGFTFGGPVIRNRTFFFFDYRLEFSTKDGTAGGLRRRLQQL